MRLIDIDDVISLLTHHHFDNDKENFDLLIHNLCNEVKCIPVAYDVDKVVEQLDAYITKIVGRKSALYQTVIEIVKEGGVSESN